jgi:hypothetical protein
VKDARIGQLDRGKTVFPLDRARALLLGHSITLLNPLLVQDVLDDHDQFLGWGVEGRPADCVKLALLELLPEPLDAAVSGLNAGANVFYSGTVVAAIEAAFLQRVSIAVSLEDLKARPHNFPRAHDQVEPTSRPAAWSCCWPGRRVGARCSGGRTRRYSSANRCRGPLGSPRWHRPSSPSEYRRGAQRCRQVQQAPLLQTGGPTGRFGLRPLRLVRVTSSQSFPGREHTLRPSVRHTAVDGTDALRLHARDGLRAVTASAD